MVPKLTVLGSGSSGNASLLEVDGCGLLIDAGLGPRQIAGRLKMIGRCWESIHAVVLTHTHGDHWKETTFARLVEAEVRLYCHREHVPRLLRRSESFRLLKSSGLVSTYESDRSGSLPGDLLLQAFPLSHDGGPTFGFRFEREGTLFQSSWTMAYAADLGTWSGDLLPHLADVDVLALEFNHDVPLQRGSGRPDHLIERVLGDEGHLSNEQAGDLLENVVRDSRTEKLRNVVQLHLSRQCNRPHLARRAAEQVLRDVGSTARVHTADQRTPTIVRMVES